MRSPLHSHALALREYASSIGPLVKETPEQVAALKKDLFDAATLLEANGDIYQVFPAQRTLVNKILGDFLYILCCNFIVPVFVALLFVFLFCLSCGVLLQILRAVVGWFTR